MALKKTFIVIFLILAICVVSVSCVYLVKHMNEILVEYMQKYSAIPIVIAGAVCIVGVLIKSIVETIQK